MSENQREPASYQSLLDNLETLHPETGARATRSSRPSDPGALSSIEWWSLSRRGCVAAPPPSLGGGLDAKCDADRLAPLINRLVRDFYTAVEAVLSGFAAVGTDVLRDVMEIENPFAISPRTWLKSKRGGTRSPQGSRSLWPRKVRKRIRDAGVGSSSALENADYAAHSIALHVNANSERAPLFRKGLIEDHSFEGDAGFWEILSTRAGSLAPSTLPGIGWHRIPRAFQTGSRPAPFEKLGNERKRCWPSTSRSWRSLRMDKPARASGMLKGRRAKRTRTADREPASHPRRRSATLRPPGATLH